MITLKELPVIFFDKSSSNITLDTIKEKFRGVKEYMKNNVSADNTANEFEYVFINGEYKQILKEQKWFWTDEWQRKISQSENDIKNGDFEKFDTTDDFLASFE